MRIQTLVAAAVLALGLAGAVPSAKAQPVWDRVHVNLPYPVTLGDKVMPAGDYTIEQLHAENSGVLAFYGANGMKFRTSAVTLRQFDENTPGSTSVSLYHVGDTYYFDKIVISGSDYGYEFPIPHTTPGERDGVGR